MLRRAFYRWAFAVGVAAWAIPAGAATPRPRLAVVPFVAQGGQLSDLGYFAPEVTRALVTALQRLGIDVGPDGEWSITGQLVPLADEHVRLLGQLRGHTAMVEGSVDDIDVLVDQLSAKLVGLLVEVERPRTATPPSPTLEPHPHGARARSAKPIAPTMTAAHAELSAPPNPTITVENTAPPPVSVPVMPPVDPVKPEAEPPRASPPAVTTAKPAVSYPAFVPNFVPGRVVAHAVLDAPSSYAGTGQAASQALYLFLNRRLRLSIVPTGTGLTSLQSAGLEGERTGARFVVMMRLKEVVYGTNGVHCKMELVVVRQGQLVYRRVVDSPPLSPLQRGREDPVFAAVMLGLDALYPDLLPLLTNGL